MKKIIDKNSLDKIVAGKNKIGFKIGRRSHPRVVFRKIKKNGNFGNVTIPSGDGIIIIGGTGNDPIQLF